MVLKFFFRMVIWLFGVFFWWILWPGGNFGAWIFDIPSRLSFSEYFDLLAEEGVLLFDFGEGGLFFG